MILSCPSCATHYFAEDSTIGESGRHVKCASCGHSWHVMPLNMSGVSGNGATDGHAPDAQAAAALLVEKSRMAALAAWLFTLVLAICLVMAGLVLRNEVVRFWPQSALAYRMLGFEVNRFGLEFDDVVHSRTFNDTLPVVTVSGRAVNVSRTAVPGAGVRIDLTDDTGRIVATRFGFVSPGELAVGSAGRFTVVIEPAPVESFEIVLSFVNRDDVPFRDEGEIF